MNVNRNDNGWDDNWWFAGVRYSLLFSPYLGEFCFVSCPLQPPSILPISSNFTDRTAYLLSSRDFVSHSTISSMQRVFIFRIASLTQGIFSSFDKKLAIEIASIISTNRPSIF